jgi:putative endopeptidase
MYYGYMEESDALAEPYYNEVIRHILVKLGYSDEEATEVLKSCFVFEKDISDYIMTTEEASARDAVEKENNPRTLKELEAEAGDFPIRKILEAYGAENSDSYILLQPDWLAAMDVLYDEDYVEHLRDYLICYTVQDYATLLDRETYDIYNKVINGISGAVGTKSDQKSATEAVDDFLPSQLGRLYSDKYVSDETQKEVTDITKEIMDEYRVMLSEETFLTEETRKEAIKKLDSLALRIAKPGKWEDDSDLNFAGSSEGGNLISAQDEVGAYWVKRMQSRINQKVDRDLWTSRVQQVNAFYDPSQNSITLCGGILGGTLYNPDMSREELFANVGDTIAHEISHAFDTTGCQFDEKGNLRNWWTQQDQTAFAARADKLVAYYDNIEPFMDVNCVGSQIEGEAIADLVAMKILLRIAGKEKNFDYDKFFRAFAQTWRTITTARSEFYALSQDTHPLPYLRVNCVVQQFDEFYETFGVKKGDGMYLAPKDRLEVW